MPTPENELKARLSRYRQIKISVIGDARRPAPNAESRRRPLYELGFTRVPLPDSISPLTIAVARTAGCRRSHNIALLAACRCVPWLRIQCSFHSLSHGHLTDAQRRNLRSGHECGRSRTLLLPSM